jgi:hypothetical protein
MNIRSCCLAIITVLFTTSVFANAELSSRSLPANGQQETILTVSSFGRYSVTVTGKQGTALQLTDRMGGPWALQGKTGETDGRIDAILDRGQYKIVTFGPEKASGKIELEAHEFQEQNTPKPSLLPELKLIRESLDDFQQRSYWTQVDEQGAVSFEAAGRNLSDLRLWQDGSWLVDAVPLISIIQPKVGQPLIYCRLVAKLNPGLYLLTAYGGPSQAWAEESTEHPLLLRSGTPQLPEAGRQRMTSSPFGIDRFLVPGTATYFRLELPEAKPASLQIAWFDPESPFPDPMESREITKKSLLPAEEIESTGDAEKQYLVTVTTEPDQPYVLQNFEKKYVYIFNKDGKYWISTIHTGEPADSVDATAILVRGDESKPLLTEVIPLDADNGWTRKFNLLSTLTLYLQVKEKGKYEIVADGADAMYRIEPFLVTPPEHYKSPKMRGPASVWDLDAGFYVLTAEPTKKGIVTLGVRSAGMTVGVSKGLEKTPVRASVHFPEVSLDLDHNYTLYLNYQPEVNAGVILRPLPLDLTQALFLSLMPGESINIPANMSETGAVSAMLEDGSLLEVSSNNGPWNKTLQVDAGEQTISVRNTGKQTIQCSVAFRPATLEASAPLPALPDMALAELPMFPVLTENAPIFLDLDKQGASTVAVQVDKPGLYVLESTGLLATSGNLRTRTNPSLVSQDQNGAGRNFLIQQYLREGSYQVTVTAQGETQGHLGVRLVRTQIQDGGILNDRLPARVSLSAGDAVLYRFNVKNNGEYKLRAFGIDRTFLCRLEDADAWPIETPNIQTDLKRRFEPGEYRLMLMPEGVDTRRVTLLQRSEEAAGAAGHGPHPLALGRPVGGLWVEPQTGQPRDPDVWLLTVPAPMDATITLTEEMQGEFLRVNEDGSTAKIMAMTVGKDWTGRLDPGKYRIETVNARRNNHVYYSISITATQLVAGTSKKLSVPGSLDVSVGAESLIELSSFGSADVRARLLDSAGSPVASNDDRADDWNFNLGRTLTPGFYRLEVEPVGKDSAETEVSMNAPKEVAEQAWTLPAVHDLNPEDSVHLFPLTVPSNAQLLVIGARSAESVGAAVELEDASGRRSLGSATGHEIHLEIPLPQLQSAQVRLRIWSVDRRSISAHITAAAITPLRLSEKDLKKGITLKQVPGVDPPVSAAAVALERPGVFRIAGGAETLRWSANPGTAAASTAGDLISAGGSVLWLVQDGVHAAGAFRASRVVLPQNDAKGVALNLEPDTLVSLDLAPATGPRIAIATAASGQPGVSLTLSSGVVPRASSLPVQNIAIGAHSAVSASISKIQNTALLWTSGAVEPIQVSVQQRTFASPVAEILPLGLQSDSIRGWVAREFKLPAGNKILRLTLASNTVAVLADGEDVKTVHWNGGEPFVETVETSAANLVLMHTNEGEDRFEVETLPLEIAQTPPLAPDAPYERRQPEAGILRLPLLQQPAAGSILHVRGAGSEALLVGRDGRILRGKNVTVPPQGGELRIEHGTGLLLAWIDTGDTSMNALWGAGAPAVPRTINPPASVPLQGAVQSVAVHTTGAALLQARTQCPVLARFISANGVPQTEVYEQGALLSAYMPDGTGTLTLRGLAGSSLSGTLDLITTPVTNAVEGLGPEVILPPGGSRLYSFVVTREGPVGVGVWSDSGTIEGTVLDASGRPLGSGVVQMPKLKPGTYLLSLRVPETGRPVGVRPALVGLQTPPTGPPEDVVRSYIESARNFKPEDSIAFTGPAERTFDTNEEEQSSYEEDTYSEEEQYSDESEEGDDTSNEGE